MARTVVGASAVLATGMGIVGTVVTYDQGAFTIGMILVIALLGSISIHAVLHPTGYGEPNFRSGFYRVWAVVVPLLVVAALVLGMASPVVGHAFAYWAGFAAIAVLAGAVVGRRSTSATKARP